MESGNCARQRKQPCALNFTVSSLSKITSAALRTKFYRTVIFVNSKESENCAHQRKQRTRFMRQRKFCLPNGYERAAPRVANKSCGACGTSWYKIHTLLFHSWIFLPAIVCSKFRIFCLPSFTVDAENFGTTKTPRDAMVARGVLWSFIRCEGRKRFIVYDGLLV